MWILERFRSRLTVSDFKARKEAHILMLSLMRSLNGEEKAMVIARLDLIGGLVQVLVHEPSPYMAYTELDLLEHCFYKDSSVLKEMNKEQEWEVTNIGALNLNLLQYFFSSDGAEVVLNVRERFSLNNDIVNKVSFIEQRYYQLELHEL